MRWRCGLLGALCGALYCLSFPSFELWPLIFVALCPLLLCIELAEDHATALWAAALAGLIANLGRGYFLVDTLTNFSSLHWSLSIACTVAISALQGGQLVLFVWLLQRVRMRGMAIGAWAPVAFAVTEFVYPRIFHDFLANALHDQSLALQIVDFGGPGLLSMAVVLVSGMLHEGIVWRLKRRPPPLALALVTAIVWAAVLGYGSYRIDEVRARMAAAPHATVGLIQANAGMFDKRKNRRKYYLRHYRSSQALEREVSPDLLIWPETAVNRVRDSVATHGNLRTPLLLGTVTKRERDGRKQRFNTALLTDASGKQVDSYDKRHLLPFGEYMPLSDTFPILKEWFPRSGHFTAGDRHHALVVGPWRITALICYEDVIPEFVREAVAAGRPNVLVNMTNDAWFGDTNAPWLHLALAKFRAVEHHRYLLRATNSGVSAIIDPVGITVTTAKLFQRARIHASIALLDEETPYGRFGDIAGPLSLLAVLAMLIRRRRPSTERSSV